MKLSQDYKKQYKSIFFGFILLVVFLLPVLSLHAQNISDIKDKISERDSDIKKLEEEIALYQKQLDGLGQQKNSLSNTLKQLDLNKKKLQTDIAVTQKKIDKTNLTIESLSSNINNKEETIINNIESIKKEFQKTNEYDDTSLLESMLAEDSFSHVWRDIDNIVTIRKKIQDFNVVLRQMKGELEDTREVTVKAKNDLVNLKVELSDQQKIVVQNANEKNKLLQETKNNEINYQKLLQDRIVKRDAFEKEIEDYEAQLKFILDPSKLPKGGVLGWPLSDIFVTQQFGKTVSSKRLYASGTHNGVDFRASVGTPVMAMADGTVEGTGDTDLTCAGASFGKFVFIKYNNGLASTYGHLSLIKSKKGQEVRRGEVVGYSGNTGHSTGPHLHISLYASQAVEMATKPSAACGGKTYSLPVAPMNAYLDVLYYLPKLK